MALLGTAYIGNRILSHAREDVRRIAESCDYIVHTMNELDLTYHKAVMSKIFAESRKAKLEVWVDPWGLGGVFGGESFSRFLLEHRDSWQIMSDGRVVPAACLNRPEWRSYVKEWVLTIRDLGGQVVFWDEPHVAFDFESEMQGIYSCTCEVCQQIFRKRFGSALPLRLNPQTREFRRETMKSFLNDMTSFARSKGLKNALCLYAFKGNREYDQIWEEAAAIKDLDIFGCDPYWRWRGRRLNPEAQVREFSAKVVESARRNGKGSQVWIQAMRLPAGTENEIGQACDAAQKEGITHIAGWSFDGGELLDPVLSERPAHVWEALEAAFKRLRVRP